MTTDFGLQVESKIASENTSGQGDGTIIPPEIMGWNWGAFWLNWIWGLGNNTYIALLVFLPLANMVMPFVLGFKGSEWAWKNKRWESIEHFKATQRRWARWGFAIVFFILFIVGVIVFNVINSVKDSEAYKLGVSMIAADTQVAAIIGKPTSFGIPKGNFEISDRNGKATFSFSVEGEKGEGTIYIDALMDQNQWTIIGSELQVKGSGKRINLMDTGDLEADSEQSSSTKEESGKE